MIYLDYAANTPADEAVLAAYCGAVRACTGNPSSPHPLGRQAGEILEGALRLTAELLGVKESEIIFTSGASESNNLAIKGAAEHYQSFGRHIVTTALEHSSVAGPMAALKNRGFEIETVELDGDGRVDPDHLRALLRRDTILVSVCAVDSELGLKQDIAGIAEVTAQYPDCRLHVDATQAVGKIPVSFEGVDLMTFAPHKFYGLNGCGVLLRRENVLLEPQIHGGISATPFRSGTPDPAQAAACAKALALALSAREERFAGVSALNRRLRQGLSKYPFLHVNSPEHAVPFILNISLPGMKTDRLQQALAQRGICVATRSACCAPGTVSAPVYALTKNRRFALSPLRISLSHHTTEAEIDAFLDAFGDCCRGLGIQ